MAKYLIILAFTPLLIFVLQMAVGRVAGKYTTGASNQLIVIVCVIIGHIPMGAAIWIAYLRYLMATPYELALAAVYGLIVYNVLAYSYFHIFNMSETARRIRILYEIYTAKQLKASDIASLYSADDMLNSRLERLLSMKQIRYTGDRYLLDRKLLYYAAKIVAGWGGVLGLSFSQTICAKTKRTGVI